MALPDYAVPQAVLTTRRDVYIHLSSISPTGDLVDQHEILTNRPVLAARVAARDPN